MVSDETFFAWLDGELGDEEAARVKAAVAGDPRLSALAAEHRAMQAQLRHAFDPLLDAPVPEPLRAALRNSPEAEVINFAKANGRRDSRHWQSLPQWAAMAATLAVGVLIGAIVPHERANAPVELHGGKIYAASSLGDALETQLASAPGGDVRIGLTFRDQAGIVCRSFTAPASAGLACRDAKGWQVRGLFAAPEGQGGAYRMAAGMDPNLAALVDSTMTGEPFDATAERAAKRRGWRL